MLTGLGLAHPYLSRRTFLTACAGAIATSAGANSASRASAKSTILIWLSGGASHIDTWDMKPSAPAEYRGVFKPISTSAPEIQLCEHLPLLARQAHHLAIIKSLGHDGHGTGDHHAGYYYNLTGHPPDETFRQQGNNRKPYPTDWPFVGSVVAAKRPTHAQLPSLIALPQKPGFPEYTRPGQFSARLGYEYDPFYLLGKLEKPMDFVAPTLSLHGAISGDRLQDRKSLLSALDTASRTLESSVGYTRMQHKAFSLLTASPTKSAFDLSQESTSTLERYGKTLNGTSMLMARRLVEAGVPFVAVYWMEDLKLNDLCKSGGGWDTHGNNFGCLKDHLLPEFDRCFSALLADMHERGLLAQTLVQVNSEMGRQPRIGDQRSGGIYGGGRDHWTNCMSVLLAGGGVRGGQSYGQSDRVAAYPYEKKLTPSDIAHTVYHAMGIENLEWTDREGRPMQLLPDGKPLTELF
ncbi:MAG: DUF1501 domain-containing protein [Planctomycetia bacterium]|nr:DUF1501 domain-containing protein [Planctomycetia bacterium]